MKFRELLKVIPDDVYIEVTVISRVTGQVFEQLGGHYDTMPVRLDGLKVHRIFPYYTKQIDVYLQSLAEVIDE